MPLVARKLNKENAPLTERRKRSSRDDVGSRSTFSSSKKQKLLTLEPVHASKDQQSGKEVRTGAVSTSAWSKGDDAEDSSDEQAGRILRVEVKNFLVYKKRSFDLGRFVNFVTGPNGSGKSSFASAISIGLGQRCALTDRGGKLEDFIKSGCKAALIRLVLSNKGVKAYDRANWGDTIIVERRISRNSKSTDAYRIRSEDGKMEKKTKKDLEILLSRFGIQIDNPVHFLNQKMSKQFFRSVTPADLYRFFYDAYGYDEAAKVYAAEMGDIESAQNELSRKKKDLKNVEDEMAVWKCREDESQSQGDLQARLDEATIQDILWKREIVQTNRKLLTDLLTAKQMELRKEQKDLDLFYDPNKALQFSLSEVGMGYPKELDSARTDLRDKERQLTHLKKNRKNLETTIQQAKESMQIQQRTVLDADGALAFVKEEPLSRSNSLMESFSDEDDAPTSAEKTEMEKRSKALDLKMGRLEKAIGNLENSPILLQQARKDLEMATENIRLAEESVSDWMTIGGRTQSIRDAFPHHQWNGHPPIGPIGAFVSLKSELRAFTVDQALSPILSAYLVSTGMDDVETLRTILKKHDALRTPIICVNVGDLPRPDLTTVADAEILEDLIEIHDPLVEDFLRKIFCIGQIALVVDAESAMNLCSANLPNLLKIYDDQGFSYTNCREDQTVTCPMSRPTVLSAEKKKERLRKLGKEKQGLIETVGRLGLDVNRLEEDRKLRNACCDEFCQLQKELNRMKEERAETTRVSKKLNMRSLNEVTGLSSTLTEPTSTAELENLTQDLELACHDETDLEDQICQLKKKISDLEKKIQDGKRKSSAQKKNSAENKKRIAALEKEIKKSEKEVEDLDDRLSRYEEVLQGLNAMAMAPRDNHEVVKAQLKSLEAERTALMADSSKFPKEKCQSEQKKLERRLKRGEEEVKMALSIVEDMKKNQIMRVENLSGNVERGRNLASEKCRMILKERNFDGHLVFNHLAKTLTYRVQTQGSDFFGPVETLSGGEKAYAMAAFLGAMWENNAPFRVLDEFDVFMDTKNREMALKCLVQQASHDKVQCIFLSPTDIQLDSIIPEEVSTEEGFITRIETSERNNGSDDEASD